MDYPQNISDEDFIRMLMGSQRTPLSILVPITTIYSIIFIVGLLGNLMTCVIIIRLKFMHTSTNFYLVNMSISDLIMLIFTLPVELFYFWQRYPYPFGEIMCITKSLIAELSMCSSVLTVTTFTIERYIAICHPIRSTTSGAQKSFKRTVKIICAIWLSSLVIALPFVQQIGIRDLPRNDSSTNFTEVTVLRQASCTLVAEREIPKSFIINFVILFFLPLTVITILYILIGIAIRKSIKDRYTSNLTSSAKQTLHKAQARKAVLKMLVALVIAFFLCFAPFHAERLMVDIVTQEEWNNMPYLMKVHEVLMYTSGCTYFLSSVINPILYNLMSVRFRKAFRQILTNGCWSRKNDLRYEQETNLLHKSVVIQAKTHEKIASPFLGANSRINENSPREINGCNAFSDSINEIEEEDAVKTTSPQSVRYSRKPKLSFNKPNLSPNMGNTSQSMSSMSSRREKTYKLFRPCSQVSNDSNDPFADEGTTLPKRHFVAECHM